MESLRLQEIYIYPVKSLGGISLKEARVEESGLQHDRRWMLTDSNYNFISQRTHPQMALLQVSLTEDGLIITHKRNLYTPLIIPFIGGKQTEVVVSIWDNVCEAIEVSYTANQWFSKALNMPVCLIYMPHTTHRLVDTEYATNNEIVSFADSFPFMMIGQSSLDDLNSRLDKPLSMSRFRPNLVFKGGAPYFEDAINVFKIGDVRFTAIKPCVRCVLTTIDQDEGTKGTEPLKTLSTYRASQNKVMFGQNLIHSGVGIIKVGDELDQGVYLK